MSAPEGREGWDDLRAGVSPLLQGTAAPAWVQTPGAELMAVALFVALTTNAPLSLCVGRHLDGVGVLVQVSEAPVGANNMPLLSVFVPCPAAPVAEELRDELASWMRTLRPESVLAGVGEA